MVLEATYFVAALTPGHASPCCGQYDAQISKVLRPSNRSNGMFICLPRTAPRAASEYGAVHPPYAKPPLVSSSGPPGACMTPSREICSSTITFLMTKVPPTSGLLSGCLVQSRETTSQVLCYLKMRKAHTTKPANGVRYLRLIGGWTRRRKG